MEPENNAFQMDFPFPVTYFQIPCLISGAYMFLSTHNLGPLKFAEQKTALAPFKRHRRVPESKVLDPIGHGGASDLLIDLRHSWMPNGSPPKTSAVQMDHQMDHWCRKSMEKR